jgi:TPR repeat protein
VPKDYVEAVKWYRKAAAQNYTRAQCFLGVCYVNGLGVPKDYVEAVEWFRKAVEHDYSRAQLALGNCYDYGLGVPKDYVQAYRWYNLAAAQGDTSAIKDRDRIADSMTPDQIAEGQRLSAIVN